MGYTPVFSSIYDGTLYGKWPDAAVFATLLPLADAQGRIDMSIQAIAGRTGWPIELLRQGIEGLCLPDTESRTDAEEGRRMVLLDPARPWGWRLVNHAKYREKARKAASDHERAVTGDNAARMAARRQDPPRPAPTREDPRRPDATGSQTQTQTQTKTGEDSIESSPTRTRDKVPRGTRPPVEKIQDCYPAGTYRAADWIMAERAMAQLIDAGEKPAELVAAAASYAIQQEAKGSTGTQFVLSPAKFYGTGAWRGPFPLPKTKAETAQDANIAASVEWLARQGSANA
jgi:hypothetical protein